MRCAATKALGRVALMAALIAALENSAICQEQSVAAFKDEIFARKILMDTIDNHADELDWMLTGGKQFDFERAVDHADTISVMLMAFPNMFPPGTNQWRPDGVRDPARDTFAAPELWVTFADFRRQAAAASQLAFKASRAKTEAEFRKLIEGLRTACDSCHALYVKNGE